MKIIKIVATRCHILRLKYGTPNSISAGAIPWADPAGAAYSAPTCHLAGFKGPTSKGKEGRAKEEGEGEKGVPDLKME